MCWNTVSARSILTLAISLALAGLPVFAQSAQRQQLPPAEFGEPFPVATFKNLNATAGEATINLADLVGEKPLVFCYWTANHERSEQMLRSLQELVDKLGRDKLGLVGVVYEKPGHEAPQIVERINALGIQVPVLSDTGFMLGQRLTVSTVPSISILDAGGRLKLANGAILTQTVEYGLDIEGVIERAASTGDVGMYGPMAKYYPVTELVGRKCPDFRAAELIGGVEKRWSSLLDPKQVNVLVFWSVDCPHCKKTMPQINEWLKRNPDGINLVSAAKISNNVMKTRTREFCKYFNFVFPTLIDENRALSEQFQVTATPTFLIIRPDGVIDSVIVSGNTDFATMFESKMRELL